MRMAEPGTAYVIEPRADGYLAWTLSAEGVAHLALPAGGTDCGWPADKALAWALLFHVTRNWHVADDWCSEFTTDVVAPRSGSTFTVLEQEVLAWLDAS